MERHGFLSYFVGLRARRRADGDPLLTWSRPTPLPPAAPQSCYVIAAAGSAANPWSTCAFFLLHLKLHHHDKPKENLLAIRPSTAVLLFLMVGGSLWIIGRPAQARMGAFRVRSLVKRWCPSRAKARALLRWGRLKVPRFARDDIRSLQRPRYFRQRVERFPFGVRRRSCAAALPAGPGLGLGRIGRQSLQPPLASKQSEPLRLRLAVARQRCAFIYQSAARAPVWREGRRAPVGSAGRRRRRVRAEPLGCPVFGGRRRRPGRRRPCRPPLGVVARPWPASPRAWAWWRDIRRPRPPRTDFLAAARQSGRGCRRGRGGSALRRLGRRRGRGPSFWK